MGYYSDFKIKARHQSPGVDDALITEALEEISGYSFHFWDDNLTLNAKWYEAEPDMIKLSTRFPEIIFEFERIGEEGGEGIKYDIQNGVKIATYTRGWVQETP